MGRVGFAAALCILAGLAITTYKVAVLQYPLFEEGVFRYWLVEAHLSFKGTGKPVRAELSLPRTSRRFLIVDESFVSRGYGLSTREDEGNRIAEWTVRKASGDQGLYYRALVLKQTAASDEFRRKPPPPEPPDLEGPSKEVALALLSEAKAQSADNDSFVKRLLSLVKTASSRGEMRPLLARRASQMERVEAGVLLLRLAGIPARVLQGVVLGREARRIEPVGRLEVYLNNSWTMFTLDGVPSRDDDAFLPWWIGTGSLDNVSGGRNVRSTISLRQMEENTITHVLKLGDDRGSATGWISLLKLPLELQSVFRVLLLVPFGAFVVVVLRNLIGVKMPGTFMPVLLALAFRETTLLWGVVVFTLLTALGLIVRAYFERLRLLLVPRVSGVLTMVVIFMAALSVFTNEMGWEVTHSVALFPMVVLTMLIERTSLLWEELGARDALIQWLSGLLGAVVVYVAILRDDLGYFLLMYPEALLVVLGLLLLLGRYTGYRLLELKRFRELNA